MKDNIDQKIRTLLLGLLNEYSELELPANPDLLKLHIEAYEYKFLQLILQEITELVGEELPLEQPLDNQYDDIELSSWKIFRKGANWEKANTLMQAKERYE